MKLFFAKYLPVEGEVKEGDFAFKPGGEIVYVNKAAAKWLSSDWRKVKLFLCSRDIKVGDSIYDQHGEKYNTVEYGVDNAGTPYWACDRHNTGSSVGSSVYTIAKKDAYRVIGEVSPEATWVREGDEFTEDEVREFEGLVGCMGIGWVHFWQIRGPCGHFH